MSYSVIDDGHIATPVGFRATGVSCGLKPVKARDLALVYSQRPCRVAAMFTTSLTRSAPVFFNQAVLSRNRENIRAVLINAGHANAGTGQAGLNDAVECAKLAADELEVSRDSVLLMSTGLIGVPLPMDRMRDGIKRAVSELDSGGGRRAALAMMTTDTRPKERCLAVRLRDDRRITLAGMAKGTRQIHPKLATLLVVLTTDLAIDQRLLTRSLQQAVGRSFTRLVLDGDTSPNDTVLLLANGASPGAPIIDASAWEYGVWQSALDAICLDLAQQIARDSAGAARLMTISVRGAPNELTARQVAESVARSRAVRRTLGQGTPDWGAMLAAVGASEAQFRPDVLELRLGNVMVMCEGAPVAVDAAAVTQALSGNDIELVIDLHLGSTSTMVWTCGETS